MAERTTMQKTNLPQSTVSRWHQLRTYLTVAFSLLAVLTVLIVTLVILNRTGSQARDQVYNQLDSVAELKSDQILRWLDEGNLAMDMVLSGSDSQRFTQFAATQFSSPSTANSINTILARAVENGYFKR